MALPKIDLPTYDIKLPSNGKIVRIRPFLVKEEKLLLMALESNDDTEIINTTKQIINNCIIDSDIDINTLPFFDVDYLFIALRAKSIGESIQIKFTCKQILDDEPCNNEFSANIDISNCEIVKDESITPLIDLGQVQVKMKYPTYTAMKLVFDNEYIYDKDPVIKQKIDIIANSIDQIIEGDNVYTTKDLVKDEIVNFVEGLTKEQFSKLEKFTDNFPTFQVTTIAKCDNCGYEHYLTYSDFTSFFV